MTSMNAFSVAAILNFIAALIHLAVIFGGPAWYRFFGAGEQLATMAENKSLWPPILTLLITAMLLTWGVYLLAAGQQFPPLPYMYSAVWAITIIYSIRAIYPLLAAPWLAFYRTPFMLWSSLICAAFAVAHWLALSQLL